MGMGVGVEVRVAVRDRIEMCIWRMCLGRRSETTSASLAEEGGLLEKKRKYEIHNEY
jgi:hypothetical protein